MWILSFVDELIRKEFTYEPYDGFCPDFSVFFNKMKYLENYAELNPRPHIPIKGSVVVHSYVDKILVALNIKYPFATFKRFELKEYGRFKEILSIFQEKFGLNEFSLKQLDVYLWLLGKEIFPRKNKN